MFWIYIAVALALFGGLLFLVGRFKKRNADSDVWEGFGAIFIVIAAIFVVMFLIKNLASFSCQLADQQEIIRIQRCEKIYQDKANLLTKKIAYYLADVYPNHEKDIFKSISPDKVDIYLAKYPELSASKTIMALVGEISQMTNDVYAQKLNKEIILQKMRYRKVSPWNISIFIPDISPEIKQ